MNEQEKTKFLDLLTFLATAETKVGELYESCSHIWKIDAQLWSEIAREERNHAAAIEKMQQMVSTSPEQFTLAEPFTPIALQTFIHMVNEIIKKVNAGQLTREKIFAIALDIEKSVIETKYNRLVKTDHAEYTQLVEQIVAETLIHKELFSQKLDELKKK
ncbi:MAG: hypothetical protein N3A72_06745 [bacterium]|nr:hypothetical protein [bacterium]